jgi:hypothetical protein
MGKERRSRAAIKKLARKNRKTATPAYTSKLSIVAVHEAGHVVGRFLTADLMGYDQAVAVSFIDMHDPFSQEPYKGPDGQLYSEAAITYGPQFSGEINDAVAASGRDAVALSDAASIYIARAKGADIIVWAKAKLMIAMAGPVAEAIDRNISFAEVQCFTECENDFVDAKATCRTVGWSDEESAAAMTAAANAVYEKFENPGVWGGLLKLAAMLPAEGRVEGSEAWAIYSAALNEYS